MNRWELVFTSIGLSLDVYAVAICKGAVVRKIETKKLLQMCLIFSVWQICSLLAGNLFMVIPAFAERSYRIGRIWYGLTAIILMGVGIYMLYKGIRGRPIQERLEAWGSIKEMCLLSMATSVDAFLTGVGFAFMETGLLEEAAAVGVMTVLAVVLGIYTGYLLGYEQKYKAHIIGGIILTGIGVEITVRYLT